MTFQYRFTHTCNHIGIGPIIDRQTATSPSSLTLPALSLSTETIPLALPFACPFCTSPLSSPHHSSTTPGYGVLAILTPFPTAWTIIKACTFDELSPTDWEPACEGAWLDGRYRQMAWIARPCGELTADTVDGIENDERSCFRTTRIEAGWRLRGDLRGIGHGNFAGLLSSLHAAFSEWEQEG